MVNGVSFGVCSTAANQDQRRLLSTSGENPAAARLIGNLDLHVSRGEQNYRGMKLSFRRRSADGVSLNGNYTLSRCFGDVTTGGFPQLAQGYTNPADPDYDRGHCDQDRTHLASFTVGYRTPEFSNAGLRVVASNWRVSGIINARSGSWLTVTTGRDVTLIGQRFQEQRVNQVLDDPYGDGTPARYLNPAAFAQQPLGTFGNHERNSIRGPNYWAADLALSRLVMLGSHTLEVRFESFNLTNNFNWGNPNTTLSAGAFGSIRAMSGDLRIMQFGIKYGF